jgi:hypothetical protein
MTGPSPGVGGIVRGVAVDPGRAAAANEGKASLIARPVDGDGEGTPPDGVRAIPTGARNGDSGASATPDETRGTEPPARDGESPAEGAAPGTFRHSPCDGWRETARGDGGGGPEVVRVSAMIERKSVLHDDKGDALQEVEVTRTFEWKTPSSRCSPSVSQTETLSGPSWASGPCRP